MSDISIFIDLCAAIAFALCVLPYAVRRRATGIRVRSRAHKRDDGTAYADANRQDHSAPALEVPPGTDSGRRGFIRESFGGVMLVGLYGASAPASDTEDLEIVHQTVRLPNLSPRLHGFRFALMSDIHYGFNMNAQELAVYFSALKKLNTGMVLLLGDYVNSRNEEIGPVCEQVKHVRAPFGVYGVTGNHDHAADAEFISRSLREAGVVMLRNEHRILTPNGGTLALIGMDAVRSGYPFDYLFAKATKGLDRSVPNILLCHDPKYFEDAAAWGVHLMVSGHTHGGQIVLASGLGIVITPAQFTSEGHVAGLYSEGASQLYVTRGIGVSFVPYRLKCSPEITVITLSV
jgi:uncharacterized protein